MIFGIDIATLVFYLFAALTLLSGLLVISAKNPVHSVLWLIFAFFNAAGLFVLLGAEYVAMTLVIVYVGAVAVLFLFVVMMLDVNFASVRQGIAKHYLTGLVVAMLFFTQIGALLYASSLSPLPRASLSHPTPAAEQVSNTEAIGRILYTDYVYPFQLAGVILLVAMVGAIVLTHRRRPGVRRQVIADQVSRRREDSIELVSVKSGEGV